MGQGIKAGLLKTLSIYKEKSDDYENLLRNFEIISTQKEELEIIRQSNNNELMKCEKEIDESRDYIAKLESEREQLIKSIDGLSDRTKNFDEITQSL